ncbi:MULTISPECIES: transglycosylase domain-containing protein [unclassified Acidisoma]|jgi:penicillin-binding protein 1A|uniref:transglycosylase domain-containing protein n=1 Tax=unclassified Acidisoma TaxID=2634065 RepID=UPI002739EC7E|nr:MULTISPECIES: transglycosylase domain-containing protein [unclassified Acidisoma]
MYNINSGNMAPPGQGLGPAPAYPPQTFPPAYPPVAYPSSLYSPAAEAPIAEPRAPRRHGRRLLGLFRWLLLISVWGGLAVAIVLLWFTWDMPRPSAAIASLRRPSLVLTDQTGRPFTHFGDLSGGSLRLNTVPAYLPEAVVAVEDRRFWEHGGLDLLGMARATVVDLISGRVVQGGSTLTQQVAKTLFLSNARTVRRKAQELLLTLWLTRHFTPSEILEIYLNRVYLGAGAWGMDAAAQTYFGVRAQNLSLWQAAMLAGLPRAPSRFNPLTDLDAATARTKEVLAAMVRAGNITPAQADAAANAIAFPPRAVGADYWFASWAAQQAGPLIPADTDSRLATTFNPALQTIVQADLAALLAGPGAAAGAHQGAVVVMDAATGAVRVLVGGSEAGRSFFNRAVLARRQAGSSFKPFVWLGALMTGMHPDDTILDAPIRIGQWRPTDYEHHFHGTVSLSTALALSLNTASVRLMQRAGGPRAVAAIARRLGVTDPLPDDMTLALGSGGVGLLEMTGAYATFFNGGRRVFPHGITALTAEGHDLVAPPLVAQPVISPALAGEMRQMLGAVVAYGTGTAAAIPGYYVGGKTGTTQESRDAWFIGGVNGRVIGIWIGNDDNTPMAKDVTGGSLPAVLFHQIALAVTQ